MYCTIVVLGYPLWTTHLECINCFRTYFGQVGYYELMLLFFIYLASPNFKAGFILISPLNFAQVFSIFYTSFQYLSKKYERCTIE